MRPKKPRPDLYAEVTDSIISALETAGSHSRPWVDAVGGASVPRNVDGRLYRGVNTLLLWSSAVEHGYSSGVWATYNAWGAHGAQVRQGEHGTRITLWKPTHRTVQDASGEEKSTAGLYMRHYTVFAAEQVDGYELPAVEERDEVAADAAAEQFFAAIGADVRFGGNVAAYAPSGDYIIHPARDQFIDAEHYYSTLAHEHGHWTGHRSRLDRDLTGRFGTQAYAAEELVAELTAAFVAARLGYHATVRDDHATYVKSWLKLLRDDNRAVFTAASKAQQACDYLVAASDTVTTEAADDSEEVAA